VIFTTLPRSGRLNASQMLAEWGDCRQAYDGPDAVAALAGAARVTRLSGKHREVAFRWSCNKRFRTAITTFAATPDTRARGRPTSTNGPDSAAVTILTSCAS
jgi:transposase